MTTHARTALLTVTCLGQFMVLLDSTIVGAALPDMQQRLHIQLTGLQWIVDAYVLLVAMLLLSGGVFADRFGRKRVFLAAGPLAGGILVEAYGWPAIFLVNAPIGVALLLAGLRVVRESRNPGAPAIDLPGTTLSVLGVGALTYGLIEGGSLGWTSPVIMSSFAAAVVVLAAFVAVEARGSTPMLPLRLFRQQLFTVSNTAMVVVSFALMGSSFFFSQFFVYVQGSSVLRAGLQTLPVSLAMVVVSPFAARLAARYGFRIVVTTGLALAGLGLLALGAVHANTAYGNVWWRLAVVGIGFALTMSPPWRVRCSPACG